MTKYSTVFIVEYKGRQMRKEELIAFLNKQTTELDELDDGLVRSLIEQITVYGIERLIIEFKSGAKATI